MGGFEASHFSFRVERHAQLEGQLAGVEATRSAGLARVNAAADAEATPLLEEMGAIALKLEPWWQGAKDELAGKKRKSIELGGCMIGTRLSRAKLAHSFEDDDKAVDALRASRFAKVTTLVRYSIDRTATLKLMQQPGMAAKRLAELGFSIAPGADTFFVQRVEQSGTLAA